MRGAALHGDVARPERGLVGVEHEHDLAFEHDPVVNRLGAVHGETTPGGNSLIRILVPFGGGGTVSASVVGSGEAAPIGAGIASVPQTS